MGLIVCDRFYRKKKSNKYCGMFKCPLVIGTIYIYFYVTTVPVDRLALGQLASLVSQYQELFSIQTSHCFTDQHKVLVI